MTAVEYMSSPAMQMLNSAHDKLIFGRRIQVLADHLANALPKGEGHVLDVGCGDGQVAVQLMQRRPELTVSGVDVMVRPETHIPVTRYDGDVLPFEDNAFDHATIVDVLHHTEDPARVLREVARVTRNAIVIKDHLREGFLARSTLRVMDWVGNRGHNVVLPYNYLSRSEWDTAFLQAGCTIDQWVDKLGLYAGWAAWACERKLHFVARLTAN